jgi:hypothetical protein
MKVIAFQTTRYGRSAGAESTRCFKERRKVFGQVSSGGALDDLMDFVSLEVQLLGNRADRFAEEVQLENLGLVHDDRVPAAVDAAALRRLDAGLDPLVDKGSPAAYPQPQAILDVNASICASITRRSREVRGKAFNCAAMCGVWSRQKEKLESAMTQIIWLRLRVERQASSLPASKNAATF